MRMDEFDAAKIACALLFLGLVQRLPAATGMVAEEAPVRLADDPLFTMTDAPGPELDLGDTARASIDSSPPPSPSPRRRPCPWRWPRRRRRSCPGRSRCPSRIPFFVPDEVPPTVIRPPAPAPMAARPEPEPMGGRPSRSWT